LFSSPVLRHGSVVQRHTILSVCINSPTFFVFFSGSIKV